ncbi:MAG: carboxymuconolactone decarboxylase family protein [Anaerolineaceae bacterium]|nr:carboxymuconolactone decarboxylase family protein [Anaerolineaceae bacterium]
MTEHFNRNIYTFKSLRQDLKFMLSHHKLVKKTMQDLDHAFVEKIMTVVTAVNGCRYCSWFHARQAVSSGISQDEVHRMMKLQFQADASDEELMALLFAQHYAETQRNPSPEMIEKLVEAYGAEKAEEIQIVIRMITFGNLSGNTFDAFLSRFKGIKAEGSNPFFEFLFFLFGAPFLLPLLPMLRSE